MGLECKLSALVLGGKCSDLVESLVVTPDADFSRIPSRNEDEIRCRQCKTDWPPDRGVCQRFGSGGDVVNGERIIGRQR